MAFWIFMLLMDLIIPITMILFGRRFLSKPPKEIDGAYGYRTRFSMKNKDTWIFAHHYFGRLWYILGLVLFPISAAIMVGTIGKTKAVVGTVGEVVCYIQLVALVVPIIPTEIALRKIFDKNGNRRVE